MPYNGYSWENLLIDIKLCTLFVLYLRARNETLRPHRAGWRGEDQTACKPGSVPWTGDGHSSGTSVAGRLARPTRAAAREPAGRPYSVLLPVGFAVPSPSPETRCALTAPFHPCRPRAGGLLSVALSLGSPPPGVTRHRVPVEPGLSSSRQVSPIPESGHPAVWHPETGPCRPSRQARGAPLLNIVDITFAARSICAIFARRNFPRCRLLR